ncbi:MAG TPA: cell division/cell wall cluster transcriptional repressor MraZ, partial [Burkholderiaceae bacterium]|nr:cell division/cell wall cluster transcriptional repressor MraZ [Burkholderiaceae bacterium]
GMGDHLEVWDAGTLAAQEQAAIEAGMPDVIANFKF